MKYQIGSNIGWGFKMELDRTGFNICLWLPTFTIVFDIIRKEV